MSICHTSHAMHVEVKLKKCLKYSFLLLSVYSIIFNLQNIFICIQYNMLQQFYLATHSVRIVLIEIVFPSLLTIVCVYFKTIR